ncbi:MAG: hypothetical protein EXR53_02905 [Dehalococcoidia bacterium]|nr:hypothetical protein [Dehalococcoidia bacterium]
MTKLLKGFGAFWWDFFVADTPEVIIGVVILMAAGLLMAKGASAWVVIMPVAVVVILGISLQLGRKKSK